MSSEEESKPKITGATSPATRPDDPDPDPDPNSKRPHVLVIPFPAQGHMLPTLDLTHQLSLRGFAVSVVVTTGNLRFLSPLLSAHSSAAVCAVTFPFPHHPSLPSGVENVQDLGSSSRSPMMAALRQLREPIIRWFKSHPNPPVAVISGFFLGWTNDLCREIGVPRFAFFTSGALLASVLHFCVENVESIGATEPIHFLDLPRAPVLKDKHLPPSIKKYIRSEPVDLEIVNDIASANFSCHGVVFNSCEVLEGEYLEYLKRKMSHDRIFAVGPLSLVGLDPTDRGRSGSGPDPGVEAKSLLTWLDQWPDKSVLYVCFGSQNVLTKEKCDALALGLEKSMTRFVWVVKKDPVPDGFEGRVAGRGKVVRGWAPQVVLLRHVAVGGFLSHCGWNSTLEAVCSRTMILAWPMEVDQYANAKLLVEYMGMAVRVCEGSEAVPDPDELGRVIAEAMGEAGHETRARAEETGKRVDAAVEPRGSSFADLDRLVEELNGLHMKKKPVTGLEC